MTKGWQRALATCMLAFAPWAPAQQTPASLPPPIQAALARAQLPIDSLSVWVAPVGRETPRLAHQAQAVVNPASLMKLLTTAVALDALGANYTWSTPVYLTGPVRAGVLQGDLVIEGRGDPKLVTERLWLLLKRVQALGVRQIAGDIVLDRSAFEMPPVDPGRFDGERFRPYNVQPDALLVSHKAVLVTFKPDIARQAARISVEPSLAGLNVPEDVPLSSGPCGDWRGDLQSDFTDPARWQFRGRYAAACGEKIWPVAPAAPERFNARAIEALWREMGGALTGTVRDGARPAGIAPAFEFASPTLGDVVRDMNKFSNNVVAQQLYLTLAYTQRGVGTLDAAREIVEQTVVKQAGCAREELRVDNGSGLSREGRVTAACLARVLQWAWAAPWMPEYVASLPLAGEHTARRATAAAGRAHLKTGSLNNVAALAGYVDATSGRRQVLVAMINHPRADTDEARQVLNAVLRWALDDRAAGSVATP